jgi:hypothetical protein
MQKPCAPKFGQEKNRPVSGFFTKITYVQVMNFIQKQYHKTPFFRKILIL